MRATEQAHALLAEVLSDGSLAIDATVGNGHDTVFLARSVGPTGHVHGFDLQADAIETTDRLLRSQNLRRRATLHHESHELMESVLPPELSGNFSAATFNLGYLPGGDKHLVTRPASTLPALRSALRSLRRGGILSVIAYQAHPGGREECEAVRQELEIQAGCCSVSEHPGSAPDSPILLTARKT